MNDFIALMQDRRFRGLVSAVAAAVMYFTPDHIDRIIEGLLGLFGIADVAAPAKRRY